MRAAIALFMLVFSGVAYGDSFMKVKTRESRGDHHAGSHYREHHGKHFDRHHRRSEHRHDTRRYGHHRDDNDAWRIFFSFYDRYSAGGDYGVYYKRGPSRDGYRRYHYDRHHGSVYDFTSADWILGHTFEAGSRYAREHVIHIGKRLHAISLKGFGSDAEIRRAYAELRDGRIVPLYALEGHLAYGKRKGRYFYFDEPRYIVKIFIQAESDHRHREAQLELSYVESGRKRGRH